MNIKPVYPKRVGPTALTASDTLIFQADIRVGIERFTIVNVGASDQTLRLYVVASGGSPATTNAIAYDMSILANDTHIFVAPTILGVSDSIYAYGSADLNIMFQVNDIDVSII